MRTLRQTVAPLLLSLAGCAGSDAEAVNDETEADEAAVTSTRYYDCRRSFSDDDALTRLEVGLSATRITVTDLSKDAAPPDSGRLDRSYKPTGRYGGAIRFQGFDKIVDSWSFSDANHMEVVVSKELKAKEPQGKLWVRTSGSGGDSDSYNCRAKPAKLKVATALRSRLACSLEMLSCAPDNPPGDTCLADLFVNQTSAGSATLRLTYLDHFGVHVEQRRLALGASAALTRTTTTAFGAWQSPNGDWTLDLAYRGGITYTGTIELPNGEKQAVQCNDLAMLD